MTRLHSAGNGTDDLHYIVFSSVLQSESVDSRYANHLQANIAALGEQINCFPCRGTIFVLLRFTKETEKTQMTSAVISCFRNFRNDAGASLVFDDISTLPMAFKQSAEAQKIGRIIEPEQPCHEFCRLITYYMISSLSAEEIERLMTPEYRRLRAFDASHGTDLLRMAEACYDCSMNITKTAAKPHVHRNTVSYRTDLIREKLEADISDMTVLSGIVRSVKIGRWLSRAK